MNGSDVEVLIGGTFIVAFYCIVAAAVVVGLNWIIEHVLLRPWRAVRAASYQLEGERAGPSEPPAVRSGRPRAAADRAAALRNLQGERSDGARGASTPCHDRHPAAPVDRAARTVGSPTRVSAPNLEKTAPALVEQPGATTTHGGTP